MNMHMNRNLSTRALPFTLLAVALSLSAFSQTTSSQTTSATPPADSKAVPVIDGGIGTCSADFIVNDANGAPVYAAQIKVHIAYGFASVHKLDLQVGTNADGKARFTGLPDRAKRGLFFEASEGDRVGNAFDDPSATCKAQFTIALQHKSQ